MAGLSRIATVVHPRNGIVQPVQRGLVQLQGQRFLVAVSQTSRLTSKSSLQGHEQTRLQPQWPYDMSSCGCAGLGIFAKAAGAVPSKAGVNLIN